MNDNKNKPYGYYLGRFVSGFVLTCITAIILALCGALTSWILHALWMLL